MKKIIYTFITVLVLCVSTSYAQNEPVVNCTEAVKTLVTTQPANVQVNVSSRPQGAAANATLRNALIKDRDRQVRKNAAISLGNMKDEGSARALTRTLNDADPAVRKASYMALKKIGKSAVPSLTQALKHRNPIVRRQAAQLLGELNLSPKPEKPTSAAAKSDNSNSKAPSAEVSVAPPKT